MSYAAPCGSTSRSKARASGHHTVKNTGHRVRERVRNSVMARQSVGAPGGGASGMRVEYLSVAVIGWYGNLMARP